MHRFLLPVLLATTACAMSPSAEPHTTVAQEVGSSLRWFPGHYLLLRDSSLDAVDAFLGAADRMAVFRGVQIKYDWSELEPGLPGARFDFSKLQTQLRHLDRVGKKLFLQIQLVDFDGNHVVPHDMWADHLEPFRGGTSSFFGDLESPAVGSGNPKFAAMVWDPDIRDRFLVFLDRLGAAVGDSAALAGVAFSESACSGCEGHGAGYTADGYLAALASHAARARTAMPSTVVIQYINFAPGADHQSDALAGLAASDFAVHAGLGGPDVRTVDSRGAGQGTPYNPPGYPVLEDFATRAPINMSFQAEDYNDPQQLGTSLALAYGPLGANFINWLDFPGGGSFTISDVIARLARDGFPAANQARPTWAP